MKHVFCALCAVHLCVSLACSSVTSSYDLNNDMTIVSSHYYSNKVKVSAHVSLADTYEGRLNKSDRARLNGGLFNLRQSAVPLTFSRTGLTVNPLSVSSGPGEFTCYVKDRNTFCVFNAPASDLGLFGSREFLSDLKTPSNWARVIVSAETRPEALYPCEPSEEACSETARRWQEILRQGQFLAGLEQLKMVNRFFNRWPYRVDAETYGVSDYWATPDEFLKFSGDCEDYSIVKYYALRKLGFSVDDMRIVLLEDTIRNVCHSVLAVKLNGEIYVLDNLTDLVLSHQKYKQYVPKYSVNEYHRWVHVSPGLL